MHAADIESLRQRARGQRVTLLHATEKNPLRVISRCWRPTCWTP